MLQNELELYQPGLSSHAKKPWMIVANKCDLPGTEEAMTRLRAHVDPDIMIIPISALRAHVDVVVQAMKRLLINK